MPCCTGATHPETTASARRIVFDSEPEINSIEHEEYLKVILQKLNPEIFAEQRGGLQKDSLRGQDFFYSTVKVSSSVSLQVDKALKDQIELLVTRDQND